MPEITVPETSLPGPEHHDTGVADPAHWDPAACSVLDDAVDEPAYGTASVARGWVAVEQPGPWGRNAAQQSHLDPALGETLTHAVASSGGRLVLIRRTGAHADDHHDRPRTVLLASCLPGTAWLAETRLDDLAVLRHLDSDALARGDFEAVRRSLPGLQRVERSVFLVCTNGRRDVCCAVRGRPVASEAASARPGQVWETSHTGGHRFAPTGLLLPSGSTLARLDGDDVVAALDSAAEGELPRHLIGPRHDRGRSALRQVDQVAESTVRELTAQTRLDALTVESGHADGSPDQPAEVVVRCDDGPRVRRWRVVVRRQRREPDRRVSCGKPEEPQLTFVAEAQEL